MTPAHKIGKLGRDLIKSFEDLRLEAYLPTPDDVWTIGWGHTKGVNEGDVCTEAEAEVFLSDDLKGSEDAVYKLVRVDLTQNQFDALVSLTFNIGQGNLASSTLLRKLNASDYMGAAKEFSRWNQQKGKVLNGLTRRRSAEQLLFLTP